MSKPIRWCDTHKQVWPKSWRGEYLAVCEEAHEQSFFHSDDQQPCSPVLLVESRDGDGRLLGMLAADQCDNDHAHIEFLGVGPCAKCGGSGYTLRAEVRANFGQADKPYAVLPVEREGEQP